MSISIRHLAISALIALGVAAGSLAATAPAYAWGQIALNVTPSNADEDALMRAGLGIYALVNGIQNGQITQNGINNAAGLVQNGGGNLGIVHQEGNGHNGTLTQNGNGNAYGLFQFGQGTSAHMHQNGHGTGLGFIFGW